MKTLRPLGKFFAFGFSICFFLGLFVGVGSRFEKPTEPQVLSTIYSRVRVTRYVAQEKPQELPRSPSPGRPNVGSRAKSRGKRRSAHMPETHRSDDDLDPGLEPERPSPIETLVPPVRVPQVSPLEFDYLCGDALHFRYITSLKNRVDHVTVGEQYFGSHSFMERMSNVELLGAFSAGLEVPVVGKRVRLATGGRWPEIAGLVLGSFSGYFAGYAISEKYTLSCEDPEIVKRLSKPEEWDTIVHGLLIAKCQSYGTVHNDMFVPLITDEKTINEALRPIKAADRITMMRSLAEWRQAYARASDKSIELTSSDYVGCKDSQEEFASLLYLNKVNISLEQRYWKLFMDSEEHKSSDLSDILTFGNVLSLSIVAGVVLWGVSSGAGAIRSIVREGFKPESK